MVTTELAIRVLTSECPLDSSVLGVAASLPGCDLFCEEFLIADTAVQALATERRDLDFRHVQPAGVLGRVVKHDAAQQFVGHARAKDLDEARSEVCVQVVEHQMDTPRRPVDGIEQVLHEGHKVDLGSMIRDLGNPPAAERLDRDEYVACSGLNVFVIPAQRGSRHHRQARTAVVQQLLALLVDTDHRFVRAPWPGIQIQQLVHPLSILLGQYGNAPHHFAPGFEAVFFSNRRIVSRLMSCIPGRLRASRSSNTSVQRLAPAGGFEQARAATSASTSVSYLRGAPVRCTSRRAKSSPPSRYAVRVRQIAVRPTPRTWQITASGTFSSSAAKIWARLTSLACRRPLLRQSSSALRSLLDSFKSVCRMDVSSPRVWRHVHCIHDSLFTC